MTSDDYEETTVEIQWLFFHTLFCNDALVLIVFVFESLENLLLKSLSNHLNDHDLGIDKIISDEYFVIIKNSNQIIFHKWMYLIIIFVSNNWINNLIQISQDI